MEVVSHVLVLDNSSILRLVLGYDAVGIVIDSLHKVDGFSMSACIWHQSAFFMLAGTRSPTLPLIQR